MDSSLYEQYTTRGPSDIPLNTKSFLPIVYYVIADDQHKK